MRMGDPDLAGYRGPCLRARLVAQSDELARTGRVFAFAGIGRPEKFVSSLKDAGAMVTGTQFLRRSPPFTARSEIAALKARAGDAVPVTTEKDFVRLAERDRAGIAVLADSGTLRRRGGAGCDSWRGLLDSPCRRGLAPTCPCPRRPSPSPRSCVTARKPHFSSPSWVFSACSAWTPLRRWAALSAATSSLSPAQAGAPAEISPWPFPKNRTPSATPSSM